MPAKFVIDTGAVVCVVSSQFFRTIPESRRPLLRTPREPVKLGVANDGLLAVEGVATMKFTAGGRKFEWDMYIAPIVEDGLIGMDFLFANNYELGSRHGLRLNGRGVPTESQLVNIRAARLTLLEDTDIPPQSEQVVGGELGPQQGTIDSEYGLVEHLPYATLGGLLVGRTLVDPAQSNVPVRLLNVSSGPVKLRKGTTVALLHEVEAVGAPVGNSPACMVPMQRVKPAASEWPAPLQELFEKTSKEMDDGQKLRLGQLLDKHVGLFASSSEDLGRTSLVQHGIDTGDARPIRQRPRRPPRAFIDEEDKIIDQQLKAGVIQESTSPWASPLVYVRKKDGTVRPCVDYRRLNDVTRKDAYPLPLIQDCLDSLSGSAIFSTLDLQSGYWQIEVKPEDRPKTAFCTRRGLYEYLVMSFGLCNAPSTFERCMELVLRNLQWEMLLLYLDDIIVLGATFDEHWRRLDEVFTRLEGAGLKLKHKKCELFQPEVSFLGHIVSADGIRPDPAKVQAIKDWCTPQNIADIHAFLGLCSYYRRLIPRFATCAHPLNRLLEAGQTFEWTADCQAAMEDLKGALVSDSGCWLPLR